jgi:hypothetical protein
MLSKKSNTGYHNTWLQTILYSHSSKNSKVLAQKYTWRPVEQNRKLRHKFTQSPDFNKCTQNLWWRKDSLFNKCCWENWISACRRLKLDPCFSFCSNINSK